MIAAGSNPLARSSAKAGWEATPARMLCSRVIGAEMARRKAGVILNIASDLGVIAPDLVRSLLRGGFARIVLMPTHGGNFVPLGAAIELLEEPERERVIALTDLSVLFEIAQLGEAEHGVPLADGGLHAGEWETSMMLSIHPELVRMEQAEAGYTGDLQEAVASMFSGGVASISPNGAIGDPTAASPGHGERYWEAVEALVMEQIEQRLI